MENQKNVICKIGIINGEVLFSENLDGDKYPSLIPDPNLIVWVNDKKVSEETTVTPEDKIEVTPKEETVSPAELNITISEDKLSAYLKINPIVKKTFTIIDQDPKENLHLFTQEKTIEENTITKEDIQKALNKQKVIYGVKEDIIDKILESPLATEKPVEIAKGKPPEPGKDATVQYLFKQEFQTAPAINPNGKVDHKEILKIPYVEAGTELVKITPAVEGVPGTTVTNEIIKVKPPKDYTLKTDDTTCLDSSELTTIKATSNGYPIVEEKDNTLTASVSSSYNHEGNVDLSTGNLRFQGNIIIEGSITEGLAVMAGKDVQIKGEVNSAAVQSGGNIKTFKNIITSTLRAGGAETLLLQLLPVTTSLEENIKKLVSIIETLKTHPKLNEKTLEGAEFLKVVRLLSATKLPDIAKEVESFEQLSNQLFEHSLSFNLPEKLLNSIYKLRKNMVEVFTSNKDLPVNLDAILNKFRYINSEIENHPIPENDITASYCLNSNLETSGNIYINGQGSYQSQLVAGGEVHVTGIVRGGMILANKDVFINEIGSEAGVISEVTVPENSNVHLKKAHENVLITIGKQKHRFKMLQTNVEAYLAEGKIHLH